jgi:hypothetical protein
MNTNMRVLISALLVVAMSTACICQSVCDQNILRCDGITCGIDINVKFTPNVTVCGNIFFEFDHLIYI